MKKLTLVESVISRRNHYQGRMAENMVNIIYFGKVEEKAKTEAEALKLKISSKSAKKSAKSVELLQAKNIEITQAQTAMDRGEENIEADKMLVKSFDELLVTLKLPKKLSN